MSELLKIAEFAKLVGRSRQVIYENEKKGLLEITKKNGQKFIDPNLKKNASYLSNSQAIKNDISSKKSSKKVKKNKTSSKKLSKKVKKNKIVSENDIPFYLKEIADSGELTFEQALSLTKIEVEKIKIYEQIKDLKDKREKNRGEVMPVKQVRAVMNKIYEIHMTQLLQMKITVIPDLAGIMQCTDDEQKLKSEAYLEEEIYNILKNIKYQIDKYVGEAE